MADVPNPFEPVRKLLQEMAMQKRLAKSYQEKAAKALNRTDRIKEEINRGLGTWSGGNKLVRSGKSFFLVSRDAMGKLIIADVDAI